MKDNHRVKRVERELQHVVAQYILRNLNPELPCMVSVTRVESNRELKHAIIYFTAMGSEDEKFASLEFLNHRLPEFQRYLGRELNMRFTPKIKFELDKGFEHMLKVESILKDITKGPSQNGQH